MYTPYLSILALFGLLIVSFLFFVYAYENYRHKLDFYKLLLWLSYGIYFAVVSFIIGGLNKLHETFLIAKSEILKQP